MIVLKNEREGECSPACLNYSSDCFLIVMGKNVLHPSLEKQRCSEMGIRLHISTTVIGIPSTSGTWGTAVLCESARGIEPSSHHPGQATIARHLWGKT